MARHFKPDEIAEIEAIAKKVFEKQKECQDIPIDVPIHKTFTIDKIKPKKPSPNK